MTQKILLISGKKQSGKDSAANYLTGYLLKQAGIIKYFELDEEGKLLINIKVEDPATGQIKEELGLLDLERKDEDFCKWAMNAIWPLIKLEKFGDLLKDIIVATCMAKREEIYGSNADKDKPSAVKWESLRDLGTYPIPYDSNDEPIEYLTNRELMEIFGTDICRKLYDPCWIEGLFNRVVAQNFPLIVISDCRYPNEAEYAKMLGAKVVRLTRNPFGGSHKAETSLDDYKDFDLVIDNEKMTQEQKGAELIKYLQSIGWVQ